MYISFPSGNIKVNFEVFQALCPAICQQFHYETLGGSAIVEQVRQVIDEYPSISISGSTIRKVLIEVFRAMQSPNKWSGNLPPELRIRRLIEQGLENGFNSHLRRQTFIIVCALTKLSHSQRLAHQLSDMAFERADDIDQAEGLLSRQEWSLGLYMLQQILAEDGSFDDGIVNPWQHGNHHMLAPQHYHHRGRAPLMLTPPRHYSRARSDPRLHHESSYGLQIGFSRYSSSAWNSPVLSPAMRSPTSYVDEVGQLQWQQDMMNGKLDGIDHKLNNLLLRW